MMSMTPLTLAPTPVTATGLNPANPNDATVRLQSALAGSNSLAQQLHLQGQAQAVQEENQQAVQRFKQQQQVVVAQYQNIIQQQLLAQNPPPVAAAATAVAPPATPTSAPPLPTKSAPTGTTAGTEANGSAAKVSAMATTGSTKEAAKGGETGVDKPAKATGKPYIRIRRTGKQDEYGCELLQVQKIDAKGAITDRIDGMVSGAPKKQEFRKVSASKSGSKEPCPEGTFTLGDRQNGVNEAVGKDFYLVKGTGNRQAIGFHVDGDRNNPNSKHGGAGSSGCFAFVAQEGLDKFKQWFAAGLGAGTQVVVDYDLGTV